MQKSAVGNVDSLADSSPSNWNLRLAGQLASKESRKSEIKTAADLADAGHYSRAADLVERAIDGAPRAVWALAFPVYCQLRTN